MNEREAIQNLKNLFSEHELCLPNTDSLETLYVVIKALEKQIPKKVNKETKDSYDNVIPRCPSCLKMFVEDYCSKCGQKIDWTVEE